VGVPAAIGIFALTRIRRFRQEGWAAIAQPWGWVLEASVVILVLTEVLEHQARPQCRACRTAFSTSCSSWWPRCGRGLAAAGGAVLLAPDDVARGAERGELAGTAKKRGPRGGWAIRATKSWPSNRGRSAGGRSAERAEALVELQIQVAALPLVMRRSPRSDRGWAVGSRDGKKLQTA